MANVSTTIRLAQRTDAENIAACVNMAYEPYVARIGKRPAPMLADYGALIAQFRVYVIPDTPGVCGVLVLRVAENALVIENVAIHPQHQMSDAPPLHERGND